MSIRSPGRQPNIGKYLNTAETQTLWEGAFHFGDYGEIFGPARIGVGGVEFSAFVLLLLLEKARTQLVQRQPKQVTDTLLL